MSASKVLQLNLNQVVATLFISVDVLGEKLHVFTLCRCRLLKVRAYKELLSHSAFQQGQMSLHLTFV